MDEKQIIKEFPVTSSRSIYLNNAGVGPLPKRTADAMGAAAAEDAAQGPRVSFWTNAMEQCRKNAAALLGAQPAEIAFLQNTAQAISTIAQGLDWRPGDRVIAPAIEYPANVYPWMALKTRGVEFALVETAPDGSVSIDRLMEQVTPNTRLVAVSMVQFTNGYRIDCAELARRCHHKGALLLVDAVQAAGALPIDVAGWDIDFCASGTHKWLLSPPGIGILYVKKSLIKKIAPTMVGAFNVMNPFDFETIHYALPGTARRFESGTANFFGFIGMQQSTSLLLEIGIETIASRIKMLTDYACELLGASGARIHSPRHEQAWSGIVSAEKPGVDARAIAQSLKQENITVSVRAARVRLSPHFFNTREQIERMARIFASTE